MTRDLNSYPRMDLRLMNTNAACPVGYEKLTIGKWPGIGKGCKCFSVISDFATK